MGRTLFGMRHAVVLLDLRVLHPASRFEMPAFRPGSAGGARPGPDADARLAGLLSKMGQARSSFAPCGTIAKPRLGFAQGGLCDRRPPGFGPASASHPGR